MLYTVTPLGNCFFRTIPQDDTGLMDSEFGCGGISIIRLDVDTAFKIVSSR